MNSVPSLYYYNRANEAQDASTEIVDGLRATQKYISPKFFYDEHGSALFTEITRQPEYYPTRTETRLLEAHANEISELIGDDSLLIEYGSGSSEKIRILLESLKPGIYAPLDISGDYLAQAAQSLAAEYPWLEVHAVNVDFTSEFDLPFRSKKRRVSFFPGSSIGNFNRAEAAGFLVRIRDLVGDEGALLIGVDLKKNPKILNAAYNDARGVTAAFNLNVLTHLNNIYGSNFDVSAFRHEATYNETEGCIQMFLVSECCQEVTIGDEVFAFSKDEKIHTENSHKYRIDEFLDMARLAGFDHSRVWTDKDDLFGVFYLYSAE